MKCKIFEGKQINKIEEKINTWLEENSDVQIIHVGQSAQFLTENTPSHTIISVFYEEERKRNPQKKRVIFKMKLPIKIH